MGGDEGGYYCKLGLALVARSAGRLREIVLQAVGSEPLLFSQAHLFSYLALTPELTHLYNAVCVALGPLIFWHFCVILRSTIIVR